MAEAVRSSTLEDGHDDVARHGRSKQGLKTYYPNADENFEPDLDIVAVPGLGASPEGSWTWIDKSSKNNGYNWLQNAKGLHKDLPKARIMLFEYPSAYTGPYAVNVTIHNLGTALLEVLRNIRQLPQEKRRPMILIGHSMGGLALVLSHSERTKYPYLFECCAACLYFGTPFRGVDLKTARLLASKKYGVDAPVYTSLVQFLTLKNDTLDELRDELIKVQLRFLQPHIEFHCYIELDKDVVNVDAESASLEAVDKTMLSRKHPNLVRFDGPLDTLYVQFVRPQILRLAKQARKNVDARLRRSSALYIDPEKVKAIQELLEGTSMMAKKKKLSKTSVEKDVFRNESAYQTWLTSAEAHSICLVVKGDEGRGKTQTALTVIDELERQRATKGNSSDRSTLFAFYLCDAADNSAEEILKSVLLQLIKQDESLAFHAMTFLPPDKSDDDIATSSKPHQKAALRLEYLWQSLLNMLGDLSSRQIFIIINNAHYLSSAGDAQASNFRFFELLNQDILSSNSNNSNRWMFTTRDDGQFKLNEQNRDSTLDAEGSAEDSTTRRQTRAAIIDLNDVKYWSEIKLGIQKHAAEQVEQLRMIREFGTAMPYWAKSIIGDKAPDTRWVDVVCMHLKSLPESTDTKFRKTVERLEKDFNILLRGLWNTILTRGTPDPDYIKEMLRALVLTYVDPTENELLVLCNLSGRRTFLRELITSCKPMLKVGRRADGEFVILFANNDVKQYLKKEAEQILDLDQSEIKRQQMLLAWRCFSHLSEYLQRQNDQREGRKSESDKNIGEDTPFFDFDYDDTVGDQSTSPAGGAKSTHICNNCDKWIEGMRHHCQDCPDYDLCDDCITKNVKESDQGHQKSHTFSTFSGPSEIQMAALANAVEKSPDKTVNADSVQTTIREGDAINQLGLRYAIRYWLWHGREAGEGFAIQLGQLDTFANPTSGFIRGWLRLYNDNFENSEFRAIGSEWFSAKAREQETTGSAQETSSVVTDTTPEQEGSNEPDIQEFIQAIRPIHIASAFGFAKLLDSLPQLGAGSLEEDVVQYTALHFAASNGHVEVMMHLLAKGADINSGNGTVGTALHIAAINGRNKVMECLLHRAQPADTNAMSLLGGPVLNVAIMAGNIDGVKMLIEKGADLHNETDDWPASLTMSAGLSDGEMFMTVLNAGWTKWKSEDFGDALSLAAYCGNAVTVAALLRTQTQQEGLDAVLAISQSDFQDGLDAAAEEEKWHVVGLLLEHCHKMDLDVSKVLKFAVGPVADEQSFHDEGILNKIWEFGGDRLTQIQLDECLYKAADWRRPLGVRFLLERCNANPEAEGEEWGNALTAAANDGELEIVKTLLEFVVSRGGEARKAINSETGFALEAAARAGEIQMVKLLVEYGADVNFESQEFTKHPPSTPLIAACIQGELEIATYLLEQGAEYNSGVGPYALPIIAATQEQNGRILDLLLEKDDILVNVTGGTDDSTPLIHAARTLPLTNIRSLVEKGAHVNSTNADGNSALIIAAQQDDLPSVEYLCEQGADFMQFNHLGQNALTVSIIEDHNECTKYLNERMLKILRGLKDAADAGNSFAQGLIQNPGAARIVENQREIRGQDSGGSSHGSESDADHSIDNPVERLSTSADSDHQENESSENEDDHDKERDSDYDSED